LKVTEKLALMSNTKHNIWQNRHESMRSADARLCFNLFCCTQ